MTEDQDITRNVEQPGGWTRSVARWPYAVLAYVSVALGLLGVLLPGLPTVPFLLLGAWAASRGSKRVHDWLHQHPQFGPAIREWREQRAVSTRSKVAAVALLATSWGILYWRQVDPRLLLGLTILFAGVATFLLTRPGPRH